MMNTSTPSILILGANGRVGSAAVEAFAQAGWRVVAHVRRPAQRTWPAGVEETSLTLDSPSAWADTYGHVTWVLHALNPLYTRWAQDALPLAEQGMAIAQTLSARWVLPGNVYNFGADMPNDLTTATPFHPNTRKGSIRVALEALAQSRCNQGRLRATVVRAGDFFGHGQGSWFDLMVARDWRRGKLAYPGPRDLPHAWAYLPDLARYFVALAQREGAPPDFEVVHFAGHTVSGETLLTEIQTAAPETTDNAPTKWRTSASPWWLIRALGWMVPMLREVAEMRYLWDTPHRLVATPWPSTWGDAPQTTPLHEALIASLRQL